MTLRIMLVGLVTSLGFEMPSDTDLSRWSHAGRDWVAARLSELPGYGIEVVQPVAEPLAQVARSDDDHAFEAASGAMAADFAADLLATRTEAPEADDAPAPAELEQLASVGLPEGEEPPSVTLSAEEVEVVASAPVEDADDAASEDEGDESSRAERIANAVRLTREAVQAWADLAQDQAEEAEPTR